MKIKFVWKTNNQPRSLSETLVAYVSLVQTPPLDYPHERFKVDVINWLHFFPIFVTVFLDNKIALWRRRFSRETSTKVCFPIDNKRLKIATRNPSSSSTRWVKAKAENKASQWSGKSREFWFIIPYVWQSRWLTEKNPFDLHKCSFIFREIYSDLWQNIELVREPETRDWGRLSSRLWYVETCVGWNDILINLLCIIRFVQHNV